MLFWILQQDPKRWKRFEEELVHIHLPVVRAHLPVFVRGKTKILPMERQFFWLTPQLFLVDNAKSMGPSYWAPVVHSSSPPLWDEGLIPPSGWVNPLPWPRLYLSGAAHSVLRMVSVRRGCPGGGNGVQRLDSIQENSEEPFWTPWDGWRLLAHCSSSSFAQICFQCCCWEHPAINLPQTKPPPP